MHLPDTAKQIRLLNSIDGELSQRGRRTPKVILCGIFLAVVVVSFFRVFTTGFNELSTPQNEDARRAMKRAHADLGDPLRGLLHANVTDSLRTLIDATLFDSDNRDEIIDFQREKERCGRYEFKYDNRTTRRRIFWGSLVADDSWHTLGIAAMEAHGIFDTVALVESNTTQMLYPRKIRFTADSKQLQILQSKAMWGPKTRVSVDYYYDNDDHANDGGRPTGLWRENLQRDLILERWKINGMKGNDVGYISDVDEVATRDFLRALQICDIPEFRPGQDCIKPKIIASTVVFEGSPMCIPKDERWYHPDMIIGECIEKIGDDNLHRPVERTFQYGAKLRKENWKHSMNRTMGPLWDATDFRMTEGSDGMVSGKKNLHTAYHFHNFFDSIDILRNKYLTYGHPVEGAMERPLGEINTGDVKFMVDCLMDRPEGGNEILRVLGGWKALGDDIPIAFKLADAYPEKRHHEFRQMMAIDEKLHGTASSKKTAQPIAKKAAKRKAVAEASEAKVGRPRRAKGGNEGKKKGSAPIRAWDSSKCVVMGLASGYGKDVFRQFVGSLRATGYTGAIILGIASDTPQDVRDYLTETNVTAKEVTTGSCTFYKEPSRCLEGFPDYKLSWARFPLSKQWLRDCEECTDGVMLTDVRDAYFQANPFTASSIKNPVPDLMLFEEIYPDLTTENWLTSVPIKKCKGYDIGKHPMLCSGSTMGTREGIMEYLDVMVKEFDVWNKEEECRSDMVGDDQSIHNHLYYSGKFGNGTITIPHRTGPIQVVGFQADKIFRAAIKQAERVGNDEGWVNSHRMYGKSDDNWQEWLDPKHGLIDPKTGYITNLDGSPSPQVHQLDRFGLSFPTFYLDRKVEEWNGKLLISSEV